MVQRRFIALVLSGLFLMSILPLFPSASFEPLQQTDEGPVEVISEDQISALESLPTSVKVSGRTENSTASPWGWAVKAGGSAGEIGYGIAVDSSGNAYVTGTFEGTATFGSTSLTSSGGDDIFIAIHQDQDMDGVNNSVDSCPDGVINWMSDSSTDYDSDGCRDADEDDDDDDDGITDASDACEKGVLGWTSDSLNDYDSEIGRAHV